MTESPDASTFRQLNCPELEYTTSDGTPVHVMPRTMKLCNECDHHTYMHSRSGRLWNRLWKTSCCARKSTWRRCGCKAQFAKEDQ